MLGYYPPNHPNDGRFHKIDVRLKRPGLRVLARKGYASPRARELSSRERKRLEGERLARTKGADQTSSELRAMLDSPIQQSGVMLDVQAAAFKSTPRSASVALAIEVDAAAAAVRASKRHRHLRQYGGTVAVRHQRAGKTAPGVEDGAGVDASARDPRASQAVRTAGEPAHRAAARPLSSCASESAKAAPEKWAPCSTTWTSRILPADD